MPRIDELLAGDTYVEDMQLGDYLFAGTLFEVSNIRETARCFQVSGYNTDTDTSIEVELKFGTAIKVWRKP